MKTMFTILATLFFFQATMAQRSVSTVATRENYRAAQSVGRDVKAKRYDKAATTVLNHREVKNRTGLNSREMDAVTNPRKTVADAKKNPRAFATKHKSSFWDRFRKVKKTKPSTKK